MSERVELSVPEIVDKLFEGITVQVPLAMFAGTVAIESFLAHVRTTKSRTLKKFRAVGMEFDESQLTLHVAHNVFSDFITLKLIPPRTPKYTVILITPKDDNNAG